MAAPAWRIATAQSMGGRRTQEDCQAVLRGRDGFPVLLAVCDGAGGHDDGEKAAMAAIACLEKSFAGIGNATAEDWLTRTINDADKVVAALGSGPTAPRTTAVAALFDAEGRGAVAHVGDSRLYLFRGGAVEFRTRDHSVVQLLQDMGRLDEKEAATHPDRSRLLKALGGGDVVADVASLRLQPGDGLALCSDGVWEHATTEQIGVALGNRELDRAAEALVAAAVKRGGRGADNATLVLARWGEGETG